MEYLNNKVFESIIKNFQGAERSIAKHQLILDDLNGATVRKAIRNKDTNKEDNLLQTHKKAYTHAINKHHESQTELTDAFYLLSEQIVNWAKFQLIEPDDAVQEGVMICFEKLARFDPSKGKAFNYLTTCIYNHLKQMYRTNRNFNELKKKYHSFQIIQLNKTVIRNGKEVLTGRNGPTRSISI